VASDVYFMESIPNNNHSDHALLNKDEVKKEYHAARMYKERMITKLFGFMIELLVIFLVPALVAVFLIKKFSSSIAITLPIAFVLSWLIAWYRYRGYRDQMRKADERFMKAKITYDEHFPKEEPKKIEDTDTGD